MMLRPCRVGRTMVRPRSALVIKPDRPSTEAVGTKAMVRPRSALVIERLTVRSDRIVCDVVLAPGAPRCSSPQMAARVLEVFPDVSAHACVNDEGDTFAAVIEHTSLPHLMEHLVISLQARAEVSAVSAAGSVGEASLLSESAAPSARRVAASPESAHSAARVPTSPAAPTPSEGTVFVGTTEWTDEFVGRARVEVSFADDLVALRAFRDAASFLNDAVLTCSP